MVSQKMCEFLFEVSASRGGFEPVEACVMKQLRGNAQCSFIQSADFTQLRRWATYHAGRHPGGVACTANGLCVRLYPDNQVTVKWVTLDTQESKIGF